MLRHAACGVHTVCFMTSLAFVYLLLLLLLFVVVAFACCSDVVVAFIVCVDVKFEIMTRTSVAKECVCVRFDFQGK